jgi:phosphatidate cytidylyltransferase
VLWLVLIAPVGLLIAVAWLVAILAAREYFALLARYGLQPFSAIGYVFITLVFATAFQAARLSGFLHPTISLTYLPLTLICFGVLLFGALFRPDPRIAAPSAILTGFSLIYIALPLLLLAEWMMPSDFLWRPGGRFMVAALLLIVWVSDIVAYLVGRSVGKRLLAPRISPQKTWEGAVGSFFGAMLAGFAVWFHGYRLGWLEFKWPDAPYWIVLAAFVNVAAQVGDLVESLIKRGAGVKDSGSILPGHGGMLDRIDALLFAAPVMFYGPRLYSILRGLTF